MITQGKHCYGLSIRNKPDRTYLLNPPHVYEFQCKHLGAMKNVSLMEHLETVPYAEGLRVEVRLSMSIAILFSVTISAGGSRVLRVTTYGSNLQSYVS